MVEDDRGRSKPIPHDAPERCTNPLVESLSAPTMAGHVLVFAAGHLPSDGVPPELLEAPAVVLGCDGGWKHAARLGLDVQAVLGDLDSVGEPPEALKRILLPDQNATDLSKVLSWCATHHTGTAVHVVGLDGGRLDHRMATAAALIEARSDAVLHLEEGDLRRIAPGSRVMVPSQPGTVIGLHPYGEVTVEHLSGVTWPLNQATIATGTQGVHNEATSTEVWIEVSKGDLVLSRSRAHLA